MYYRVLLKQEARSGRLVESQNISSNLLFLLYGNSLLTVGLYKDGMSCCPTICQYWGFVKAIWPPVKSLPDLLARSFAVQRVLALQSAEADIRERALHTVTTGSTTTRQYIGNGMTSSSLCVTIRQVSHNHNPKLVSDMQIFPFHVYLMKHFMTFKRVVRLRVNSRNEGSNV
jgi:hypothetical protein